MDIDYTNDYLLDKKVKIFQPKNGYRTSSDAILVSSLITSVKKNDTILDVGSGTGGISLCLAKRLQDISPKITGIELQSDLVSLSNLSAKENNFAEFLQYINLDIKQNNLLANCSFHHVISNPPYSEKDMPSPNQSKAMAHNHQDFSLQEWLAFCLKMLRPFGFLYLINRAEALSEILYSLHGKAGNINIIPIYSKTGQNAKRIMVVAQKDSKAPLKILPGFITHKENGEYTSQAEKILRQGLDFFTATQPPLL